MITDLRLYKFITYILMTILTIPFAILIGFDTRFLLGPKGIGFLLLSIWGAYRTSKYLLNKRLIEIKRRQYDKAKNNNSNIN